MSFLIGLVTGIFGGLVGIGGGVVMVPVMGRLYRVPQSSIHGTSLVAVVFSGLSGAFAYALNGTVDYLAAMVLAVTASVTAPAGARYCTVLPGWKLRRYFGIFLIALSLLLIARPHIGWLTVQPLAGWEKGLALSGIGLATGFIAGLLGIGGGAFTVLGLVLVAGVDQYTAQGCTLLALVPAGTVGAVTYWRRGNVIVSVLPGLIGGIVLGAFGGGMFANLLPESQLKVLFAVVLLVLGVDMIQRSRQADAEPCEQED